MSRTALLEVPPAQTTGTRKVTIKADILDDISSRFLINLSNEERADPIKLCSHIEVAHWYYLDLVRPEDHTLPACNLKEFMATVFQHCPWLVRGVSDSSKDLELLISDWKTHKYQKPLRGAILLNQDWTKCLLVQGYPSGTSWTFPKGKLEEGETDKDAAVREVFEETGFDIRVLIQKSSYLDAVIHDSNARMYIIPGVPDNTHFEAKTRKEIKNIKWFEIKDLPSYKKDQTALKVKTSSFFMVIPFIGQLRRWIQKKKGRGVSASFKIRSQVQGPLGGSNTTSQSAVPVATRSLSMLTSASAPSLPAKVGRVAKVPLLGARPGDGGPMGSVPPSLSASSVRTLPQQQQFQRQPPTAPQNLSPLPVVSAGGAGGAGPYQHPSIPGTSSLAALHRPTVPHPSSLDASLRPRAMLSTPSSFQHHQPYLKGAPPPPSLQSPRPHQPLLQPRNLVQQQHALNQPILQPTQGPRQQPANIRLQQQQQQQAPPLRQLAPDFVRLPHSHNSRLPQHSLLQPGTSSAHFVAGTSHQQQVRPLPNSPSGILNPQLPTYSLQQQQFQGSVPVLQAMKSNPANHSNTALFGTLQYGGVAAHPSLIAPPGAAMQPASTRPGGVAMQPVGVTVQPLPTRPGGVAMQPDQHVDVAVQRPVTQPVVESVHMPAIQHVNSKHVPFVPPHGCPGPAPPLSPHHGHQMSLGKVPLLPNPSGVHPEAKHPRLLLPNPSGVRPEAKHPRLLLPNPSGVRPEAKHPRLHGPQHSAPRLPFQPVVPRGQKTPLLPSPSRLPGQRASMPFAIKPAPDFVNFKFNQQDILKNLRA